MDTNTAKPTTVGEMLREEFLNPMGSSSEQVAQALGVTNEVMDEILRDRRRLNEQECTTLANFFKIDESFWCNLQATHDRWTTNNER